MSRTQGVSAGVGETRMWRGAGCARRTYRCVRLDLPSERLRASISSRQRAQAAVAYSINPSCRSPARSSIPPDNRRDHSVGVFCRSLKHSQQQCYGHRSSPSSSPATSTTPASGVEPTRHGPPLCRRQLALRPPLCSHDRKACDSKSRAYVGHRACITD